MSIRGAHAHSGLHRGASRSRVGARTIEETGKKLGVSVPPSAAPPEQAYYYRPYYHRRYYHDHPKSKRVEFRCPDPACNPYLAFAAMLMAGLNGFESGTSLWGTEARI